MNNGHAETLRARSAPTRWWFRVLAINIIVAASVGSVMALAGAKSMATVGIALAFANLIGVVGAFVVPPLMRRYEEHGSVALWVVVPAALLGLAAIGAVVIGLGVVALGVIPPGQLWRVIWPSFGIAAVTTLGLGVGIALHESTRINRAQATLARHKAELARQEAELARSHAERLATEAQLASLEAQLHPHFLYNTLNTIGVRIPDRGARGARAYGLLCDLAALLRFSLDRRDRYMVPLGDELQVVRAYLQIQQARFKSLAFVIDVPAALQRCEVPPFALLPMVENSVVHVAQDRPGPTRVRIAARAEGDHLQMSVWDDGPGFSLAAIIPRHGLDTLRQRLEALYGAVAGLSVDRVEEGTMVTIRVPLREGQS